MNRSRDLALSSVSWPRRAFTLWLMRSSAIAPGGYLRVAIDGGTAVAVTGPVRRAAWGASYRSGLTVSDELTRPASVLGAVSRRRRGTLMTPNVVRTGGEWAC
jgi:hypothetical protein